MRLLLLGILLLALPLASRAQQPAAAAPHRYYLGVGVGLGTYYTPVGYSYGALKNAISPTLLAGVQVGRHVVLEAEAAHYQRSSDDQSVLAYDYAYAPATTDFTVDIRGRPGQFRQQLTALDLRVGGAWQVAPRLSLATLGGITVGLAALASDFYLYNSQTGQANYRGRLTSSSLEAYLSVNGRVRYRLGPQVEAYAQVGTNIPLSFQEKHGSYGFYVPLNGASASLGLSYSLGKPAN